jgi:uncharacterized membrane protein
VKDDTRRGKSGAAAIWLGVGMGGFFDGIVLHQIAQWHNMLSTEVPPETMAAMRTNMTADGWFHAATWLVTLVGIFLLFGAARTDLTVVPVRCFVGRMLMGWGGFNLAEGIVDHHLLQLHHVRDLPVHVPLYDWLFLLVGGLGLLGLGWMLARSAAAAPMRTTVTSSTASRPTRGSGELSASRSR